ncbi:hypothetical protein DSECCO2_391180 [anaerobic digester metagenome]
MLAPLAAETLPSAWKVTVMSAVTAEKSRVSPVPPASARVSAPQSSEKKYVSAAAVPVKFSSADVPVKPVMRPLYAPGDRVRAWTEPTACSRSQSPPRVAAPVASSEAATSAPVRAERVATKETPSGPAAALHP